MEPSTIKKDSVVATVSSKGSTQAIKIAIGRIKSILDLFIFNSLKI
jgi:hypothetical protein